MVGMGTEVSTYYIETFCDIGEELTWLAEYLTNLMTAQLFHPVSRARMHIVASELVPYPEGKVLIRAEIDVEEFDIEVEI